jgi:hypothetical protein
MPKERKKIPLMFSFCFFCCFPPKERTKVPGGSKYNYIQDKVRDMAGKLNEVNNLMGVLSAN